MPGPEFFQTRMGQKFYERDVPELINQLKASNLLKLYELEENKDYLLKAKKIIKGDDSFEN